MLAFRRWFLNRCCRYLSDIIQDHDCKHGFALRRSGGSRSKDDFMRRIFHASLAALTLMAAAALSGTAFAQAQPAPAPQDQQMKQIPLTEKQIQSLLAAQQDMNAISDKLPEDAADKPDPKIQAQLEAAAKKNGFANYDEYGDVIANVSLVLSGIDPKTKAFSEPPVVLKKQIADVTADKNMPEKDKKAALEDLNETLKYTSNVQYPDNVTLVTKYYDKLNAALKEDE
jgi:hypothetical protein